MGQPGLVRVCLRDKQRRVSGLARPWRVPALVGALDADPETIPDLLVSVQRFFFGHPVRHDQLRRLLRRPPARRVDRRYIEAAAGHGLAVFDLDARRIRIETRGIGWRRAGWLYYHDGEAFTRRRVPYRVSGVLAHRGRPGGPGASGRVERRRPRAVRAPRGRGRLACGAGKRSPGASATRSPSGWWAAASSRRRTRRRVRQAIQRVIVENLVAEERARRRGAPDPPGLRAGHPGPGPRLPPALLEDPREARARPRIRPVMKWSRERLFHLSARLAEEVLAQQGVVALKTPDDVRNEILRALSDETRVEESIDAEVRKILGSYARPVPEGSPGVGGPLPEDPRRGLPAPVPPRREPPPRTPKAVDQPEPARPPRAVPSKERGMKLCQFQIAGGGRRVGVLDGDTVIDITAPRAGAGSVLDLLIAGRTPARDRAAGAAAEPRAPTAAPRVGRRWTARPAAAGAGRSRPLDPPEVWGRASRIVGAASTTPSTTPGQAHRGKGIYDYVYEAERPELFYKRARRRARWARTARSGSAAIPS